MRRDKLLFECPNTYYPLFPSLMMPLPGSPGESDNRNQQKMEMKVWDPDNPLTDRQIDQFLVVAR